MPTHGKIIRNLIVGEPLRMERDVYGIPQDYVLLSARLLIFAFSTDPDSDALIKSEITPTESALGKIKDDGANDGVGSILFNISETPTKAELVVDPTGSNNEVKFTATTAGQDGNNITIAYVDPLAGNVPLSVTVSGKAVTVTLATNSSGIITTTGANIVTVVSGSSSATALVQAVSLGSGAALVTAMAPQNLSGGNGGTINFEANVTYYYKIQTLTSYDVNYILLETGTLTFRTSSDNTPTLALTTRSLASESSSPRLNSIVNQYVDVILHDFRQLRVWDEHARRSSNDPRLLRLTYQNINSSFYPEVFNGQNELIDSNDYTMDFEEGTLKVKTDTGNEDYFVTYEFNMFPSRDLEALASLTLQEVNLGGADGGYITDYATIDTSPPYWDAPIALGTVAKAFRRLASNSGLWKNYLIWVSDNNGPGLAKETSDYYQTIFDNTVRNIKKLHFIAAPTYAFYTFKNTGFGFYSNGMVNSRFREMQINRITSL